MAIAFSPDTDRELKAVRARTELTRIRNLRTVRDALLKGHSQLQIADAIGVSQPEVSRLAKTARLTPAVCEPGPREVILRYAVDEIDHAALVAELERWPYTFGEADPTGETYLPGTWDQVERSTDLLPAGVYEDLFTRTAHRRRARPV